MTFRVAWLGRVGNLRSGSRVLQRHGGATQGPLSQRSTAWDHRIGDFALAWRGKYDDVIHGYAEVSPLEPEEWELLTPLWWAFLIDVTARTCGMACAMMAGRSESCSSAPH